MNPKDFYAKPGLIYVPKIIYSINCDQSIILVGICYNFSPSTSQHCIFSVQMFGKVVTKSERGVSKCVMFYFHLMNRGVSIIQFLRETLSFNAIFVTDLKWLNTLRF